MSTDRLTEIVNYLGAISREIGNFRSEVNSRLQTLEGRLDEVRADIRKLNRKFDVLTQDSMDLRGGHRDLEKRVEVLEGKAGITDSI